MAAGHTHSEVVSILEGRFDYLSARNVLSEALGKAALEQKDAYSEQELQAVASALATMAGQMDHVVARLTGDAPAPEAAPANGGDDGAKAAAEAGDGAKAEAAGDAGDAGDAAGNAKASGDDGGKKKKKKK